MENKIWIEEKFLEVEKHFENADFIEGKKVLEEILEQEPGYGRAHNHLGWLYYAKFDDFERAGYHLKLATKFAPEYPAGFLNYAYLLQYTNKHSELVAHAAEALKVDGVNKSLIYTELGKSYEVNGQYKDATKAYLEAKRFSLHKKDMTQIEEHLERVKLKADTFSRKLFFF